MKNRFVSTSTPHRKKEAGQSLVEMAVALPVILLVLAAATDLGRAFYAYVSITNAAREGARYGASFPSFTSDIQGHVHNELANSGISVANEDITISCNEYVDDSTSQGGGVNCSDAIAGDYVSVHVEYPFRFITGLVLGLGSTLLTQTASMAIY